MIKRRTSRKKYRASLQNLKVWCKENRHLRIRDIFDKLKSKLRGYNNYYGIRGNHKSLSSYFFQANRILFKWLNRRSQRKSYNWKGFNDLLDHFKLPRPKIHASF